MGNPHKILSWVGKREDLPRQLGLALVLGLLSVLVLIVTADAYVAKKVETKLVDFDNGTFLYTGLLDLPPLESVQLLPIGLTGSWQASSRPLPRALVDLAAIANGDTIYVAGGTDYYGQIRREVYFTTMSLLSDLTPWQSATSLPEVRAGAGMAVCPIDEETSMLYVVGGARSQDFDAADTIYRASIDNTTGEVGAWITDTQHLTNALYYASVVQHGNALYVIGGFGGTTNGVAFNTVDYAPINADGSLNHFKATSPLTTPVSNAVAVIYTGVTTDTLYLIGGQDRYTSTFQVYFADFKPGGGLTPWKRSLGQLPRNLWGHAGLLLNGEIVLTGGVVDAIEPSLGISSTVKAALVDTDNPSFRLYDWCIGVPPPTCTIGAWQSGALLPQVRALHGTATGHSKIYVMGGEDADEHPKDTVYYGTVTGVGALYSPEGRYRSDVIDLGQTAKLRKLEWGAAFGHPGEMGLKMQYRYAPLSKEWVDWSTPQASVTGTNYISLDPSPPSNVRYVQYQANFTTSITNASPLLNWVQVYYEVGDPEVAVSKDTGEVVSVTLRTDLDYTIHYTNNGEWVAENVVLTETLPENTTYAGGPEWQQIDASNVYTRGVGNVLPGGSGVITFSTRVMDNVPDETSFITNVVDINYPVMIDAFLQPIDDPELTNNHFEFNNPFLPYAVAITKDALPLPGEDVWRGRVITYTMSYSNLASTTAAVDAYIVDLVPTYTTYLPGSIVGPGVYYNNPPRILWSLGTIEGGEHGQVGYSVTVDESCPVGTTLSNEAVLSSSSGRPKTSNEVTHFVIPYAITITKDALPLPGQQVWRGRVISYTLTYSNPLGSAPAINAYVADLVPTHTTYRPGSIFGPGADASDPTQLRWNLGTVAAEQQGQVGFAVTVDESCPVGINLTNTATLSSGSGHPQTSNAVTHPVVAAVPRLLISKDAIPSPGSIVRPGSTITYTIRYTNAGAFLASQPILTDVFDLNQSYTVVSTDRLADVLTTTHAVWHLEPLAPGQEGSIQVVVQLKSVLPNWTITNRARIASSEGDPAASLVISHLVENPPGTPLVDLVAWNLHVVPDKPKPGQAVTFYVTISNTGTLDAIKYFWAELYIKPQPSYPPAGPSDSEEGYCLNNCSETRYSYLYWVGSLKQGQTNEAWFTPTNTPAVLPTEGCYDVYVQVDVAFENELSNPDYYNPFWGVYPEASEDNNIAHIVVCVGPRKVYLPAIFKRKA